MAISAAVASALIGGGINLAGMGMNQLQGLGNRRWTEKMYNKQMNDNISLWNMENEYNSPANIMKRFEEAGINPHMVTGQGIVQANMNHTPMQNAPLPYHDVSGIANMATLIPQQRNIIAQTENMKQQTIGQALTNESKAIDNNLKSKYAEIEQIQRLESNAGAIDNLKATYESTKQTTLNLKESQLILQQNYKNLQLDANGKTLINAIQTIDLEYKKQLTQLDVLTKQLQNAKSEAEISKIYQDIKESQSRINNLNQSSSLMGSTLQLNQQQFDMLNKMNPLKLTQSELDILGTMIKNKGYVNQNQLTDAQRKAIESNTWREEDLHKGKKYNQQIRNVNETIKGAQQSVDLIKSLNPFR